MEAVSALHHIRFRCIWIVSCKILKHKNDKPHKIRFTQVLCTESYPAWPIIQFKLWSIYTWPNTSYCPLYTQTTHHNVNSTLSGTRATLDKCLGIWPVSIVVHTQLYMYIRLHGDDKTWQQFIIHKTLTMVWFTRVLKLNIFIRGFYLQHIKMYFALSVPMSHEPLLKANLIYKPFMGLAK